LKGQSLGNGLSGFGEARDRIEIVPDSSEAPRKTNVKKGLSTTSTKPFFTFGLLLKRTSLYRHRVTQGEPK
jgi:hypothetical protein